MNKLLIFILCGLLCAGGINTASAQNSGTAGSIKWSFADGVLTISGTGAMTLNRIPWLPHKDKITTVVIGDGITSIQDFGGHTALTSVIIPNSVTSIDAHTFLGCSALTSVVMPNSVTYIGSRAFEDCVGLTSVTVSNALTDINEYAFKGCRNLTSVMIPNSVTEIDNSAFEGCSGLTSVTIPNSVTKIGEYAFAGCSGLTSLAIPNSVTEIGQSAFKGCTGLTSVAIPASVTTIGFRAFYGCSAPVVAEAARATEAAKVAAAKASTSSQSGSSSYLGSSSSSSSSQPETRAQSSAGESEYNNGIEAYFNKDNRKAVEWYTKGAEKGHAGAMANLGTMYLNGLGVSKDYRKAFEWYTKGAEKGDATAVACLGVMYSGGLGVPKDERKANEYYVKAANMGHEGAKKMVADIGDWIYARWVISTALGDMALDIEKNGKVYLIVGPQSVKVGEYFIKDKMMYVTYHGSDGEASKFELNNLSESITQILGDGTRRRLSKSLIGKYGFH
jgi:hypothetical protein